MQQPARWSSERFEVLEPLGAGGYGVVYRARDRERGGEVAIKRLSRVEPGALLRFKREFRMLADVAHPNLVAPYELVSDDRDWLFTMPIVEGVEMSAYVCRDDADPPDRSRLHTTVVSRSRDGALSIDPLPAALTNPEPASRADLDRLVAVTRQLVEGVLALHGYGLVHRDLKPSNVLVDASGRVRVLDFGLVAPVAEEGDRVVGTPAYMAPEQGVGGVVGPAADWYAVGVMLFECLTGTLPFDGDPLQLIDKKMYFDAPRARERVPSVPEDLDRLVSALLARDPQARPTGEDILATLRGPARAPASASVPPPSIGLVGRETEVAELDALLATARGGGSTIGLIVGASGMGKSHLLAHVLESWSASALVIQGRCREDEQVPHRALDELFDSLCLHLLAVPPGDPWPEGLGELVRRFPVLGALAAKPTRELSPRESRRAAAAACRSLLARVARERPLVLFVDDVQWGDEDSAQLLLDVLEPGPVPGVLLLFACRAEGVAESAFLRALDAAGHVARARRVSLGPLSEAAATELATACLERPSADAVDRVVREAAGHPMFLSELARESTPRVGVSLDAVLAVRLEALSPAARALIEITAVAGAPVPRDLVEGAAGAGPEESRALARSRLVRVGRSRGAATLEPFHDRVREVALARAGDAVPRHHRRLADALLELGDADPERLSRHLHAAGAHEEALPHTLAAARAAREALALQRAVSLLRLALDHTPADDAAWPARQRALADALVDVGRGSEAAERYRLAAAKLEAAEAVELERRAVEQWLRCGQIDRGLDALDRVLHQLDLPSLDGFVAPLASFVWDSARLGLGARRPAPLRPPEALDPRELARVDALLALGAPLTLVDSVRGLALTQRGVRLAYRSGDPRRLVDALTHDAIHMTRQGSAHVERVAETLGRARELAVTLDDLALARVEGGVAVTSFLLGRFRETQRSAAIVEDLLSRAPGRQFDLDVARRWALKAAYFTGDLAWLRDRTRVLLRDAIERDDLFNEVGLRLRLGPVIAMMEDRPDQAFADLDRAMERWSGRKVFLQHFIETIGRAEVALYAGDGAAARAVIEDAWAAIERTQILRSEQVATEAYFVRACAAVAAGDLDGAARFQRRLSGTRASYTQALGRLIEAAILRGRGDRSGAAEGFARAAAALEAVDLHSFAWAAHARRAELAGDDEARSAALDRFAAQGVLRPEAFLDLLAPLAPC
ncbi:MAG: AAA family ATPase [Sandaracinaceae bacterium]|nr:AAA family ATPase [Sandaracinaceae bacterium]